MTSDRPVLVSGSHGFIGSRLMEALLVAGLTVIRFPRTDLGSLEAWRSAVRECPTIFHLAAQTSCKKAEEDVAADWRANVLPMVLLLEACKAERPEATVVFTGTVTQIGVSSRWPINENSPGSPITVYDLHKQMAEDYLLHYARQVGIQGVCLRLPNVYGPGISGAQDRGILNRMANQALSGQPLSVYGTGQQIRDYLYVDDVVPALIHAANSAKQCQGGFFLLGTGEGRTFLDAMTSLAAYAERYSGRKVQMLFDPTAPLAPIECRSCIVDATLFRSYTGWKPEWTFDQGVEQVIRWTWRTMNEGM